jgi:hypothetical protein
MPAKWITALRLGLLCFPIGILAAAALAAQSPIGDPVQANEPALGQNDFQNQTILAGGDLLVVWEHYTDFDQGPIAIQGRRLGLHHPPGELLTLARGSVADNGLFNPLVAPRADGGFLFTVLRDDTFDGSFGCRAIAFGKGGQPLTAEREFAPNAGCGEGLVPLADGSFGTAWLVITDPPRQRAYRMFARLSSLGEVISRPRRVNPDPLHSSQSFATLAGNASGEMTLAWDSQPALARDFSAFGGPLPPLLPVRFTEGLSPPAVAVLPDGERIFAGLDHPPGDSNHVAFQRFAPDGTPLGTKRPAQTPQHALFGIPKIAADRFGNFVIAWGSLPGIFCDPLEVRLFRADGTPVSAELFTSLAGKDACEGSPRVSFGEDGTFAVSWVDPLGVSVAWFSASPGDEICLTRGGRLLCDTGRTGGLPEIDQPDAPAAFDAIFLADFDGDGRADPCYHSGTTFRCDLGHRGRGPRASVDFGLPSDRPLMGDVDGDGRADACVRRGDLLACDTAHTGGPPGFTEHFGDPDAIPLLGDLDGDGRADLCLFEDGVFSCDLGHHGGAPDLVIRFGQAGDLPVLGDYDGDGHADPCVLRGRTLRCDLRHDGGTAEAILRLAVQPGDGILMGNLDGL